MHGRSSELEVTVVDINTLRAPQATTCEWFADLGQICMFTFCKKIKDREGPPANMRFPSKAPAESLRDFKLEDLVAPIDGDVGKLRKVIFDLQQASTCDARVTSYAVVILHLQTRCQYSAVSNRPQTMTNGT